MPEHEAAAVTAICRHLEDLEALIARETALNRAGRLRDGLAGADEKATATRRYLDAVAQLTGGALSGPQRAALRSRHERFEAALAENLAVLSTVHSVAESILRELAQKLGPRRPTAYGPDARRAAPAPIALSRAT